MKYIHHFLNSPKRYWVLGMGAMVSLSAQAMDAESPLSDELFFSEVPVVLSATRLKQSLRDSPASVTIIDRKMIDASGAVELVDLLRLVPGFQVGYYTGSKFTVSSHGNMDRFARDMQVLVDGRSIYDPAFGGVTWSDQELDMDDIQRIEVIRGPNASTHGSNSFAGVINIITRHPAEQPSVRVKTLIGDGGKRQVYNRFAGTEGNLAYRVALKYDENNGFDTRHDSSDTRWFSIRSDYQINSRDALLFETGKSGGTREDGFPADAEQPFRATEDSHSFQQLRWTRSLSPENEYYLQIYHNYQEVEDDFANPGLGLSLGYGFKSQRYDMEFQHTYDFNPTQRLVWGLGARRDEAKGTWTFKRGDWMTRDQYRAFGNLEWRLTDNVLLNLGGMYEKFDQKEGFFSPMAALNLKLDEMNTLRLRATRAYRMPTFWEDFADQSVLLTGPMIPVLQTYKTTTNLKPEYIESFELGYLGSFQDLGLTLDMKLFHEEIKDMIAEVKDLAAPDQPFAYINSGSFNINGFEVGLRWNPSPRSLLHIAYSLANSYGNQIKKYPPSSADDYRMLDRRRVPPLTVSVQASHQFDNGIQLSTSYYYMDDMDWAGDGDYIDINRRWDIKISKPFKLERSDGEVSLIFQNIGPDNDFQDFHVENIWEERIFLQASLNWH